MKSLIIDSDPADCKLLQEILEGLGECRTFNSGNAAITAVKEALEAGAPFELITLEVVLSDMDGTEALFEIRDMEEEWGIGEEENAVIVMVTAIADRAAITTAFSAGCDDYVVKPFDKKGIVQRFKKGKLRDRLLPVKGTDKEITNPIDLVIDRFNKGKIDIPPLPGLSVQLNEMAKKGLDFKEISMLLKQDMSITSKIISMSNASYYGAAIKTKTVEQAISRLGLVVTKQYVESLCNRAFFVTISKKFTKATEELWKHSLHCAVTSEVVAKFLKLDLQEDIFTMGLMHDIGKMVLLRISAELESKGKFGGKVDQSELFESIDAHHNTFGAKVLKKWDFGEAYAQIALCHDDLGKQHPISKELQVVHFANLFVKEMVDKHPDPTGMKAEDAESTQLLGITPDMVDKIREEVDRQMSVYG